MRKAHNCYVKTSINIEARRFRVTVANSNNESMCKYIVLSKEQLRSAQVVGQSSKELIYRICERSGYHVIDIDKPERKTLTVDLAELWEG